MFSFSGLLAIVMDDFTIVVVEVDTGNIVRRLTGHEERLTDLAFSPDARWLVSSAVFELGTCLLECKCRNSNRVI